MNELKLSEIKGLLPVKSLDGIKDEPLFLVRHRTAVELVKTIARNELIDELSTKNLLDYVEAVVCMPCKGKGILFLADDRYVTCDYCNGTGAAIRMKEDGPHEYSSNKICTKNARRAEQ